MGTYPPKNDFRQVYYKFLTIYYIFFEDLKIKFYFCKQDRKMAKSHINIKNKKAYFNYEIVDKFEAGLVLTGTEIKSIREGKASLTDAYCKFKGNELFVEMKIAEYSHGGVYNHEPNRLRKLLLTKRELKKLQKKVTESGYTIVPLRLYINKKGLAKMEIALAKGKKKYDRRQAIKERDLQREMQREHKFK